MSIIDKELSEALKSWNLIGEPNQSPNSAQTGINSSASQLYNDKQPSSQKERGKDPYLVFRNAPSNFNIETLMNLCSTYGRVLRGRKHENGDMFFVNFKTMNDLLNVIEGLKYNPFGLTMELGRTVMEHHASPNSTLFSSTSTFLLKQDIERTPHRFSVNQENPKNQSRNDSKVRP